MKISRENKQIVKDTIIILIAYHSVVFILVAILIEFK